MLYVRGVNKNVFKFSFIVSNDQRNIQNMIFRDLNTNVWEKIKTHNPYMYPKKQMICTTSQHVNN